MLSLTLLQEVRPFGIEVVEVVTGFVRSNILHHGLYAPEDSPYLPIKGEIERIKYEGNRNGMPAEAYAESVVDKLMRKGTSAEIWEGKLSWLLGFIVNVFPLWLSVRHIAAAVLAISLPLLLVTADNPCRIGSFTGSSSLID